MGATHSEQSSQGRQMSAEERQQIFDSARSLLSPYMPGKSANATYTDPGQYREAQYTAPTGFQNTSFREGTYQNAPAAQTLSNGDYGRLEQNIIASRTAPLDRAKALDIQNANQSLADRGIWSSGVAQQELNKVNESYAPQYAAAGADAANQRYNLQAGELQGLNQYNLANNQGANTFNAANNQGANAFALQRAGGLDAATQDRNAFALQNAQGGNTYGLQAAQGANAFSLNNTQMQNDNSWRPADYMQGVYNQTGGSVSSSAGRSQGVNWI